MRIQIKIAETSSAVKLNVRSEPDTVKVMPAGEIVYVGGSGLPTVTKKDDGKILQVEDGEWTKKHLPPCDEELSQMSANAVQNKVVTAKFVEVETTIGNIDVLLGTL